MFEIDKEKFGTFIAQLRKEKGLTQKEVAGMLGISQSYISRLEKRIMKRLRKEIVKYE